MNLCDLFDDNETDKGSFGHRYDRVYEPALAPLRDEPIRLLEIGVLRGGSLAAWVDYFPRATVIGVDTFERVPADSVSILRHPRVKWFRCDSTEGAPEMISPVDVIIDDGLHNPVAQRQTFEAFWPLLKDGGVYFIEDVLPFDSKTPRRLWNKYPSCTEAGYKDLLKALQPYNVKHHDLRTGNRPLSYMIEVRK